MAKPGRLSSWLGPNKLRWLQDHWLLFGLVLVAIFRLVYLLWQNVPVLNQDEAAILLNARLIWETGKDEWGKSYPLIFQSFGDAKLPGYIYLTSLLGGAFGFTSFIVRFPSFVAGIINIVLVYLLGKRFFSKQVAIWSTLFFVSSPWTWHYSSVGFEANVGLAFFLGSLLLAVQPIITAKKIAALSVLLLLGGLTYNSPFLLSPLILLALWLSHPLKEKAKLFIGSISVAIITVALLVLSFSATQQKKGISIFSDPTLANAYPQYREQFQGISTKLLGNKAVYFGQILMKNFVNSWTPEFLVIKGGNNPWHTIPETGHILAIALVFAIIGIIFLAFSLKHKKWQERLLVLLLLVGGLFPAVITTDAPHATRSLFFFTMLVVVAGFGLGSLLHWKPFSRFAKITTTLIPVIVGLGFLAWWLPAQMRWRTEPTSKWYVGYEDALNQIPPDAALVFVVDREGTLYTRTLVAQPMSWQQILSTLQHSPPDAVGIVRGEAVGRYRFVHQPNDIPIDTYGLEPQSATEWAIIKP